MGLSSLQLFLVLISLFNKKLHGREALHSPQLMAAEGLSADTKPWKEVAVICIFQKHPPCRWRRWVSMCTHANWKVLQSKLHILLPEHWPKSQMMGIFTWKWWTSDCSVCSPCANAVPDSSCAWWMWMHLLYVSITEHISEQFKISFPS